MQCVRQVQTQKKTQVAATFWDVAILTKLLLKLDPWIQTFPPPCDMVTTLKASQPFCHRDMATTVSFLLILHAS